MRFAKMTSRVAMTPLSSPAAADEPPVPARDTAEVDEGVQHLCGIGADGGLLQQQLFEAHGQHVADGEDEQQGDDRARCRAG